MVISADRKVDYDTKRKGGNLKDSYRMHRRGKRIEYPDKSQIVWAFMMIDFYTIKHMLGSDNEI